MSALIDIPTAEIGVVNPAWRLSLEPPGACETPLDARYHMLDVYLDGAMSVFRLEPAVAGAPVEKAACPPKSFRLLKAGCARAVYTVRSGTTVRLTFSNAMFDPDLDDGEPSACLVNHFDAALVGVATAVADHLLHREESLDTHVTDSLVTVLMLRLEHNRASQRSTRGACRADSVQRAIEYIEGNLDTVLTLERVARVGGLSPYHFARMFRRNLGKSVQQYVLERRIAKAQELLIHSNASLADVAFQSGYGSQSHMSALFRKHLGRTPGQIRREAGI